VRVCAGAAALPLVTLVLAGCSSGGTPAASSAATSAPPGTTSAPPGTANSSPAATGTGTSETGTGATATATSEATGTGSTTRGRGGKGQKGSGLAPAPGGLAKTAGYRTYEGCQGTCTGAVPTALRRPLKLPSADGGPCPITLTARPVSPRQLPAGIGFRSVSGSQWLIAEVTWTTPGSYTGPILIRGAMLGGGPLGFGTGAVPYNELQLLDAGHGAPRVAGGGRAWITYTRVRSGGC
jgi:hypothetical protein